MELQRELQGAVSSRAESGMAEHWKQRARQQQEECEGLRRERDALSRVLQAVRSRCDAPQRHAVLPAEDMEEACCLARLGARPANDANA